MIRNTETRRHRAFISLIYKDVLSVPLCLRVLCPNYDTLSFIFRQGLFSVELRNQVAPADLS